MAAAWGMAPWAVEDAPLLWVDRYREWTKARAERDRRDAVERQRIQPGGGRKVKRLI